MIILGKRNLDVPKRYIYFSALLFIFAVLLQVYSTEEDLGIVENLRHVVLFGSVYLFWALTIEYLNGIIRPFVAEKSRIQQIFERLLGILILVLCNLIVSNFLYYGYLFLTTDLSFGEAYLDFKPYIFKSIIIRFFDVVVIGLILKIIEAYKTVQEQKIKVISLKNQLQSSQLEALRNQLDPHFLFNTLHTLNTLIGYDDEKAQSMVIKITNLLRKMLDKREKQLISFDEELEYFTNYLEIEEERFHDRLEILIEVEDSTRELMVPTLILQPLIENAFKHGIATLEGKGQIILKARTEADILIIQLSNSINNNSKLVINSTKLGLDNLQSRLKQTYGEDYLFTTEKDQDKFTATIHIKHTKAL